MGVELVDTTRLWMRRASILEPEWVERVAPHLCESHYSGARWDREQGGCLRSGTRRVRRFAHY